MKSKRKLIFVVLMLYVITNANTTKASSATHVHVDGCYTGTKHTHVASTCGTTNKTCTNSCAKHTHSTSSCSYEKSHTHDNSCYEACNGSLSKSEYSTQQNYCRNCDNLRWQLRVNKYTCNTCGDYSLWATEVIVDNQGTCCSNSEGPDMDIYLEGEPSRCFAEELTCGLDDSITYTCGYNTTTYYKNGVPCPVCGGDRKVTTYNCGKTQGVFYLNDGSVAPVICNKKVHNIVVKTNNQTIVR